MSKRAQTRVEQQSKKRRQRFISIMVITVAVVLVASRPGCKGIWIGRASPSRSSRSAW